TALQEYEGTLFIVSHDRYLINKLADRIYWLTPEGAVSYKGSYDSFLEQRKIQQEREPSKKAQSSKGAVAYQQRKVQQASVRKQKAQIRKIENRIEELDNLTNLLNAQLSSPEIASDYEKAMDLTHQLETAKNENDRLMEEWETLSQAVEGT
ncbi:MAG TPA: ABC transporter ATP-binding protein, partial [Ruminococcaceae bacterium]|nr:ABC transporter ATP-binding protein [Oscillospiraceae bacterium]